MNPAARIDQADVADARHSTPRPRRQGNPDAGIGVVLTLHAASGTEKGETMANVLLWLPDVPISVLLIPDPAGML